MPLPDCHKGVVDETWRFENNWGWQQVKLSHNDSATSINVTKLFSGHQEKFLKVAPLEIPEPEVGPADSVSQVGTRVSAVASSSGSQGNTVATAEAKASPAKLRKILKSQGQTPQKDGQAPAAPEGTGMAGPAKAPGAK